LSAAPESDRTDADPAGAETSAGETPPVEAPLPTPQDVIAFWFGVPGSPDWLQPKPEWFRKDPAFDALIEARFGGLLERALHGRLEDDVEEQNLLDTRLARIIVCDQFSRNVWRGRPKAFALDPIALATSRTLIGTAQERAMPAVQRIFVYMPLMHSEVLADQRECVSLFEALAAESALAKDSLDFAHRHLAVIERFGRFPHRNEILGRKSTDEELAFLRQPGSSF
jgi:uncharacterized protein (DUF924 family)